MYIQLNVHLDINEFLCEASSWTSLIWPILTKPGNFLGKCHFPAGNFLVPNFLFSCLEMCHSNCNSRFWFLNKTVPPGSGVGVASFDMGTRIDVDRGAPGGGMAVTGTGNMVGSL